jgi:hypothetical protein
LPGNDMSCSVARLLPPGSLKMLRYKTICCDAGIFSICLRYMTMQGPAKRPNRAPKITVSFLRDALPSALRASWSWGGSLRAKTLQSTVCRPAARFEAAAQPQRLPLFEFTIIPLFRYPSAGVSNCHAAIG